MNYAEIFLHRLAGALLLVMQNTLPVSGDGHRQTICCTAATNLKLSLNGNPNTTYAAEYCQVL